MIPAAEMLRFPHICAILTERSRRWRKQDEYRKKEYGVLPPSRSV